MDRRALDAFHAAAACVDADPALFDESDPTLAARALGYCSRCTAVAACRAIVKPGRSHYDGVAAAAVYRNGRVIVSLARDRHTRALVSTIT